MWDRVRRELDKLPIPLVEEPTGKELYHQGYDPWDFKCYDLSCLEGRNLTYTPPPGVVVRAGGKREFDNEGPNVHESLRMLGGKPATELREFPEVVAKRKRGEKPYLDDDDEAGGASTQAAVDVGARARPRPRATTPRRRRRRGRRSCRSALGGRRLRGRLVGAHRADGAEDAGAHSTREGVADDAHRVQVRRLLARALARPVYVAKTTSIGNARKRYVTFEPDHGGWNNIRMGMETAALFAWSTGRILVLPAKARLYLVSKAAKAHGPFDFYDFDLITEGGGVTTTEDYLEQRRVLQK